MENSKKILYAVLGVVVIVAAVAVGVLFGSRMNRPSELPQVTALTEAVTQMQEETILMDAPTEEPDVGTYTEEDAAVPAVEEIPQTTTAAPKTTQATTRVTTTKPTTQTTTTTTTTTTTRPTTTTTTQPTTQATTTAKRNGPYNLVVNSDGGANTVYGAGRYAPGELVVISLTLRDGFSFVRWDSSDEKVLPDGATQTYSFRMPESNVTLRAVTSYRPQVTLVKGTGIASVSGSGSYDAGRTVSINCSVQRGYTFEAWQSNNTSLVRNSSTSSYSFTMPSSAITLTAYAKKTGYTVTLKQGAGISGVSGAGLYNPGETVTVNCSVASGYNFGEWTVSGRGIATQGSTNQKYSFTMPAGDITLTASAVQQQRTYTVSLRQGAGISSVSGGGTYKAGETVIVNCSVSSGYSFSEWTVSRGSLQGSYSQRYAFTMPAGDVILTANAAQQQQLYTVSLKSGVGITSVSGAGTYRPGDSVTVYCQVSSGYTFSEWTASRGSIQGSYNQRYTFTMPAGDVTLIANATQQQQPSYYVSIISDEGVASVSGGGSYHAGDSVTVNCSLANGYAFDEWTSSGSGAAVSGSRSQRYTFTMPAGNVTLTASAHAVLPEDDDNPDADRPWG